MDIPPYLKTEIQEGKAVLFFGCGASLSAQDSKGNRPPNAKKLGELLSNKFLGGLHTDFPLSTIAELAISECGDIVKVQEYIREIFQNFEPTPSHKMLCSFRWWGLATTNYDRLIERAYEMDHRKIQEVVPLIDQSDRVDEKLRSPKALPLVKLHGCISRTTNPDWPLILTTDQYIRARIGRERIFRHFTDWAIERTVVFVGHSVMDSDIRMILHELSSLTSSRSRYYIVAPTPDPMFSRMYENMKITLLSGTFDEFISSINTAVPSSIRGLPITTSQPEFPITERFTSRDAVITNHCKQFLETDVEYVRSAKNRDLVASTDFYKGMNPGWSGVEQNLDVRRNLTDTILVDSFLIEESKHLDRIELVLIKAHAGAGKTVLMRRLAWDAAHEYNLLCLYVNPHGVINSAALKELVELCNERIYLFVDDAADRVRELISLVRNIGPEGKKITVILAERINEWNFSCEALAPFVTSENELAYLDTKEIEGLLLLLEEHRALGTLAGLSAENRRTAFAERAGRQLLVALHEATMGKPFEDIIANEYENIQPSEAQRLYLSICILDRLDVPVRAGVIARIHGIRFEDFREHLFKPLEHIVQAAYNPVARDYVYRTRHPHIADIVFHRVLNKEEVRFEEYMKCLRGLHLDYSTDAKAFRRMIRGRPLLDLFPTHELVKSIHEEARRQAGDDAYLLHQIGIYEMHRPGGDLRKSADLFNKAAQAAQAAHNTLISRSVQHSMAELSLRSADLAPTQLERDRLLSDATKIASAMKSNKGDAHGHHTLVKANLRRLQDTLELPEDEFSEKKIEEIVKQIERDLSEGLQQFPGDSHLLEAESQFASLLSDSERFLNALEQAFNANPRVAFIALRLARYYEQQKNTGRAKAILEAALNANDRERKLHYAYAKLLIRNNEGTTDSLLHHLARSFSQGDDNYDAQLLYGRELFVANRRDEYKAVFKQLSLALVDPETKTRLLYPLKQIFAGTVTKIEAYYCFIAADGISDWIYANRNDIHRSTWADLTVGTRVTLRIAFNMKGPGANDVRTV
ncbi:MAG TPA: SIR2 family protein [Abditibacteriaceae bacterium]|jgi:hypothetical protein